MQQRRPVIAAIIFPAKLLQRECRTVNRRLLKAAEIMRPQKQQAFASFANISLEKSTTAERISDLSMESNVKHSGNVI